MDKEYALNYPKLEASHWWWQFRRRLTLRLIHKNFPQGNPLQILEIGCGAGINLKELSKKHSCEGIEPDAFLRKIAIQNTQLPISEGTLPEQIPVPENSKDVILLLDVLEHVKEDRQSLIKLHTLLKENGILILNVPAMQCLWSIHDELNHHYRRYSLKGLKQRFSHLGYKIAHLRYWGTSLVPLAWLSRVFKKNKSATEYKIHLPKKAFNFLFNILIELDYFFCSPIARFFGLSLIVVAKKSSPARKKTD